MRWRHAVGLMIAMTMVAAACSGNDGDTADTVPTTRPVDVLVVGVDVPNTPFLEFDNTGAITGFEADIIEEVGSRLGLAVALIDTPDQDRIEGLLGGDFDLIGSAVDVTAATTDPILFSDPIYRPHLALVVNRLLTPAIDARTDLGDGDTVAVQTGAAAETWAALTLGPDGVVIQGFPALAEAFNALEAGRVQAVLTDERDALMEEQRRPDLAIVETIASGAAYGFGMASSRADLVADLNQALGTMVDDGTYQDIFDRWLNAPAGSVAIRADGSDDGVGGLQLVLAPGTFGEPGDDVIAGVLELWTGRTYSTFVAPDDEAALGALCAAPDTAVAFVPAHIAVRAESECAARISMRATVAGSDEAWTAFIVPRDSETADLGDLDGALWAHASRGSVTAFLVPAGVLASFGISTNRYIQTGNDAATVLAVYAGEAAFGTVEYLPPTNAAGNSVWDGLPLHGDVPDNLLGSCAADEETGLLMCGEDYVVNDARQLVTVEAPNVVQRVRILAVTEGIPHGAVVFGPAVVPELREGIMQGLADTLANHPDTFDEAFGAYGWTGLERGIGDAFDVLRSLLTAQQ